MTEPEIRALYCHLSKMAAICAPGSTGGHLLPELVNDDLNHRLRFVDRVLQSRHVIDSLQAVAILEERAIAALLTEAEGPGARGHSNEHYRQAHNQRNLYSELSVIPKKVRNQLRRLVDKLYKEVLTVPVPPEVDTAGIRLHACHLFDIIRCTMT